MIIAREWGWMIVAREWGWMIVAREYVSMMIGALAPVVWMIVAYSD